MVRVRVRYTKLGKVRFVSHRDLARIWERGLRKAQLPVAYTEGFSPRPKLHFGLALPTGHASEAEFIDVDFGDGDEPVIPDLPERLTPQMPEGIDVDAAAAIDRSEPSLQQAVTSCSWRLLVKGSSTELLHETVRRVLEADQLPYERERKGRREIADLRPLLLSLSVEADQGQAHETEGHELRVELGTQPRTAKPIELVQALDADIDLVHALRTHQWMTAPDASRREPLARRERNNGRPCHLGSLDGLGQSRGLAEAGRAAT